MTGLRTWWRKLGGLMVACLMALVLGGPILDALVCKGEDQPVAAVNHPDVAQTVAALDQDDGQAGHEGPEICAHGHCHHGVTVGLLVDDADLHSWPRVALHAQPAAPSHTSQAPTGLERPPRA